MSIAAATAPSAVAPVPDRRRELWSALLVAAIAWSAHFLRFRHFGLYEDDYFIVARQLAWTWRDALAAAESTVRTLNQGRPIGFLIANLVPFAGFQLGGVRALPLVYLVASAIVVANALLAHRVLHAAYGSSFALLGALAFTLYPADTTQPFLTHALVLQPSLTLTLLALLAYQRQRQVLAYVLAAGSLLTYESGVLAFFAAPLLRATWDPGIVRRWARHVAVVIGIVAAVVALRVAVGEGRAANLQHEEGTGWSELPARVLEAAWTGPQVSLPAFVKRPAQTFEHVKAARLPFRLTLAAVLALTFAALGLGPRFAAGLPPRPVLARAGITGIVMLVGGYAFEFSRWHFPPIHEAGRISAVHLGATLGAAVLVASLLCWPWTVARNRAARMALGAVFALYIASLFAFRLAVQEGFVDAANQQRRYWSRIVSLVPDLTAETVVILMDNEPPQNAFIGVSSWSDTWVIRFLLHDAFGRSPCLVGGYVPPRRGAPNPGFDETLVEVRDGRLRWSRTRPPWLRVNDREPLAAGRLVVLQRRGLRWKRRAGSITLAGVDLELPPAPPGAALRLAPGPLYDLLLAPAR